MLYVSHLVHSSAKKCCFLFSFLRKATRMLEILTDVPTKDAGKLGITVLWNYDSSNVEIFTLCFSCVCCDSLQHRVCYYEDFIRVIEVLNSEVILLPSLPPCYPATLLPFLASSRPTSILTPECPGNVLHSGNSKVSNLWLLLRDSLLREVR